MRHRPASRSARPAGRARSAVRLAELGRGSRPRSRRRSCASSCSSSTARSSTRLLAGDQPRRVGAVGAPRSISSALSPAPGADPLVVAATRTRQPVRCGDPQDHQLGVAPRQLAARHQPAGEPEPAPEEAAVAGQRREDVRRPAARREPQHPHDRRVHQPDLSLPPGAIRGRWSVTPDVCPWDCSQVAFVIPALRTRGK